MFEIEVKVIRYTHTLTGTIEYVEEEGVEVSAVGCIHKTPSTVRMKLEQIHLFQFHSE